MVASALQDNSIVEEKEKLSKFRGKLHFDYFHNINIISLQVISIY